MFLMDTPGFRPCAHMDINSTLPPHLPLAPLKALLLYTFYDSLTVLICFLCVAVIFSCSFLLSSITCETDFNLYEIKD